MSSYDGFDEGWDYDENNVQYVKDLISKAKKGDAEAQYELVDLYSQGYRDIIPEFSEEAVKWCKKLAEQDYSKAQIELAIAYRDGEGVQQSFEEAYKWILKAINQDDEDAFYEIDDEFIYGFDEDYSDDDFIYGSEGDWSDEDSDEDSDEGVYYFDTYNGALDYILEKANSGNIRAQLTLAQMYLSGYWIDKSYENAIRWYNAAADQGNSDALFQLGRIYEKGWGVPQSFDDAVKFYKKAEDCGSSEAMSKLEDMYYSGLGVEQSYEEAFKRCYIRAQWQKGEDCDWAVLSRLGDMYYFGRGVEQSYEEAAKWYAIAAPHYDFNAATKLGIMYEEGKGVQKSYEEALKYYRIALTVEYPDAKYRMGLCYELGHGVKQSYSEAAERYGYAIHWGDNVDSPYRLGLLYEQGNGVEKSLADAEKYYKIAAENGNADAQKALDRLKTTADQNKVVSNSKTIPTATTSSKNDFPTLQILIAKYPNLIASNPNRFISALKEDLPQKKSALFCLLAENEPTAFNDLLYDKNRSSAEKRFCDMAEQYSLNPEPVMPLFGELWELYQKLDRL